MERRGHHHNARHRRPADEGGPEIQSIPWFGTTWYTGGLAYWLRRALLSLVMLAALGVVAGIVGFLLVSIFGASTERAPGFVALSILTVVSIVGFVWTWGRLRRTPDAREIEMDHKEAVVFVTGWRVLGLVALVLIVVGVAAGGATTRSISSLVVGVVGFAFFGLATCLLGPMLAVFLKSITAQPPLVRLARQEVDAGHLERGLDSP